MEFHMAEILGEDFNLVIAENHKLKTAIYCIIVLCVICDQHRLLPNLKLAHGCCVAKFIGYTGVHNSDIIILTGTNKHPKLL